MRLRTAVTQVLAGAAVLGGVLAATPTPAAAAVGLSVVGVDGVARGTVTADPALVNVCDWQADGVQVGVEFLTADDTRTRRIAPLGGCTPAFSGGSTVVAVRGWADTFANPWVAVS